MYNYVIQTNHTKEGATNDKLELRKLLIYTQHVYQIQRKINELTDKRKRKQIPFFNLIMPVFVFLLLQYESFHTIFSASESMGKRLRNCIRGKIPKVDAVQDTLARVEPKEVEKVFDSVVAKTYQNAVLRSGTIGGYVTVAVDGVELFSSTRKSCRNCLTRKSGTEGKEFFTQCGMCNNRRESPFDSKVGNSASKRWSRKG